MELEDLPMTKKRKSRTVQRISSVPLNGTGTPSAVPLNGTKTPISGIAAVPLNGNNVSNQYPPAEARKKKPVIVGRAGRSGVPKVPGGNSPEERRVVGPLMFGG